MGKQAEKVSRLVAKSRLPSCPSYLHGVVRVLVVEDQGLLDELVVALQLVNVVLVVDDVVLVLLQLVHLVLQGPRDLDGAPSNLLCVGEVGALSERGSFPGASRGQVVESEGTLLLVGEQRALGGRQRAWRQRPYSHQAAQGTGCSQTDSSGLIGVTTE